MMQQQHCWQPGLHTRRCCVRHPVLAESLKAHKYLPHPATLHFLPPSGPAVGRVWGHRRFRLAPLTDQYCSWTLFNCSADNTLGYATAIASYSTALLEMMKAR